MSHPSSSHHRSATELTVLVTGYGGFLGGEITHQLLARGNKVVGLGRHEYARWKGSDVQQIVGDIRQETDVLRACEGVDAVIHTAAVAGIWGPWQLFHQINAIGTQHVVHACRHLQVPLLVYCSSPSVTFDGEDQAGIDESVPYPQRWLCHYPHTKAIGEQAVLGAHRPGELHTAALRPHLIWGADDPHLFPRLIERAKRGKLRVVGDGQNLIDTVHVRNAAAAHLAALDALAAEHARPPSEDASEQLTSAGGRAYFITQDEPVVCWDWIAEILQIAGVKMPEKRISFAAAWHAGHLLEACYRWTGRRSEPPMTRFLAAQLAKHHYFDISAAKQFLGYRPIISLQEGLDELRAVWSQRLAKNRPDA